MKLFLTKEQEKKRALIKLSRRCKSREYTVIVSLTEFISKSQQSEFERSLNSSVRNRILVG